MPIKYQQNEKNIYSISIEREVTPTAKKLGRNRHSMLLLFFYTMKWIITVI